MTEDGRRLIGRYYPDNSFVEEEVHYLRLGGDLYNDSDVSILLKEPCVTFWGAQRPTARHINPEVRVAGENVALVPVPAHGRTPILIVLPLFRDELDEKYASTIPVITFEEVNGRKHDFRAGQTSFHGPLAAWPRKGQLPVLLLDGRGGEAETDEPKLLMKPEEPITVVDVEDRGTAV